MYHNTIEEEKRFLLRLWNDFSKWSSSKSGNSNLGTERIVSDIICPKCKMGKVINYGIVEEYKESGTVSFGMNHICEKCGEKFDRSDIGDDIFFNTPREKADYLETPLGRFMVLVNGEPLSFEYRVDIREVEGYRLDVFLVNVDTSMLKKGDKIHAGIDGVHLTGIGGDERCSYAEAENDDVYMVINGEEIIEMETDIEYYTFISDYTVESDGFDYLIHQDPKIITEKYHSSSWMLKFDIAWGKKDICGNYEEVIEMAVW